MTPLMRLSLARIRWAFNCITDHYSNTKITYWSVGENLDYVITYCVTRKSLNRSPTTATTATRACRPRKVWRIWWKFLSTAEQEVGVTMNVVDGSKRMACCAGRSVPSWGEIIGGLVQELKLSYTLLSHYQTVRKYQTLENVTKC